MTKKDKTEILKNAYDSGLDNTTLDEALYDEIGNYIYELEEEVKLSEDEKVEITTEYIKGYVSGFDYLK